MRMPRLATALLLAALVTAACDNRPSDKNTKTVTPAPTAHHDSTGTDTTPMAKRPDTTHKSK